ncbi:TetR/AcrR family transcriptional regulator [Rugosimonospora acidiphila]|uniref:TetR/AcrR family transcriptional regulator n=1 Tax=Rugosimonospora acidiphila TaxID=556531 RepID=A0ABP9RSM9_9ACTN
MLDATAALLDEGGYPAATVDAIAGRSGVSKATIYKHWPTRAAVAASAFGRVMADEMPPVDTGSTEGDVVEHLRRLAAFYASARGQVFAQLLAACVVEPAGAPYFREFFLAGRREAITAIWQRAVARGDVDPGVAVDDFIDLLAGPLIFRLLSGHAPLTAESTERLARTCLAGLHR